jgi:FtsH-binding integral membrane protein
MTSSFTLKVDTHTSTSDTLLYPLAPLDTHTSISYKELTPLFKKSNLQHGVIVVCMFGFLYSVGGHKHKRMLPKSRGGVGFRYTTSVSKYLSLLTFFYNFDHLSYPKNYTSTKYFVHYMFLYCMYFKFDLSFYIFAIIFGIR